jgi:hypothetical protein
MATNKAKRRERRKKEKVKSRKRTKWIYTCRWKQVEEKKRRKIQLKSYAKISARVVV